MGQCHHREPVIVGQCNPFQREVGNQRKRLGEAILLALKMEGGTVSQGMHSQEPRKGRESKFPLETPEGISPANSLTLAQ